MNSEWLPIQNTSLGTYMNSNKHTYKQYAATYVKSKRPFTKCTYTGTYMKSKQPSLQRIRQTDPDT